MNALRDKAAAALAEAGVVAWRKLSAVLSDKPA